MQRTYLKDEVNMQRTYLMLVLLSYGAGSHAYVHSATPSLATLQRRHGGVGARHYTCMQGAADFNLRQSHATAAADGDAAVSRRAFIGQTAFLAGMVPSVANAFDFKTEASGDAVFDVPAFWTKTAEDPEAGTFSFSNPVSGKVLDQVLVREYEAPKGVTTTTDVGKIEKIKVSKAFGATSEVDKADMVGAAVRKGTSGKEVYYDFDFAIAPKECKREDDMLIGSCMYNKIILLSCCVKKGGIYVLEISASAEEWKKNGPALRSVRDSFNVRI